MVDCLKCSPFRCKGHKGLPPYCNNPDMHKPECCCAGTNIKTTCNTITPSFINNLMGFIGELYVAYMDHKQINMSQPRVHTDFGGIARTRVILALSKWKVE